MSHRTLLILGSLDQSFALRVNLRHFFDPLYQDHTALGHTLGVFFRGSRLAGAVVLYAAIVAAALFLYLSWAAIPIIILWKGFF